MFGYEENRETATGQDRTMYALHPLITRTPEELFATAWRNLAAMHELDLLRVTEAYVEAPHVTQVLDDYAALAPHAWSVPQAPIRAG